MAMRLSEVHPAIVHFPIALLPISIGADAIARVTGNRELAAVGKWCIAAAAASTALAGVSGLIAQEEVALEGHARQILQTHRTLNFGALAAITTLAIVRARRRRSTLGYLLVGAATVAVVGFSAYLGGTLVYAHGAGVEAANGLYGPDPRLTPRNAGRAAAQAARDLRSGMIHTAQDVAKGEIAPIVASTRAAK